MADPTLQSGTGRAWLELVRAPNLLTVPGDVLAGWLLAAGAAWHPALLWALAASLALYAFGLISNDVADFKTDLRERPQRPLPSRRIAPAAALGATLALACAAPLLAWRAGRHAFDVAVPLFLCIVLYNSMLKKSSVFGPLTLGLCRGLNLLLGAAAARQALPAGAPELPPGYRLGIGIAAGVLMLYIGAVSALARREVETGRAGLIGALLRGLLPLQAGLCACASLFLGAGWMGWATALLLLALWPVAGILSKRFYMS